MGFSKHFKLCVFVMILSVIASFTLPLDNVAAVAAATVKISDKNLTLEVGQTKTLQIIGTKKGAIWSSSDKSVAKVNTKGKVTAIKAGKATITVCVSKKKYTCKVTVKEAKKDNTYITNAPFDAVEAKTGYFKYVIPKNWSIKSDNESAYLIPTSSENAEDCSSVDLDIEYTGKELPDITGLKDYFDQNLTQDKVTSSFTQDLINSGLVSDGTQITYTNYNTSEFKATLGTAYKIEFTMSFDGMTRSEALYFLYINNYNINVSTDDIDDNETPDAKTVGEYILSSLQLK